MIDGGEIGVVAILEPSSQPPGLIANRFSTS